MWELVAFFLGGLIVYVWQALVAHYCVNKKRYPIVAFDSFTGGHRIVPPGHAVAWPWEVRNLHSVPGSKVLPLQHVFQLVAAKENTVALWATLRYYLPAEFLWVYYTATGQERVREELRATETSIRESYAALSASTSNIRDLGVELRHVHAGRNNGTLHVAWLDISSPVL